MNSVQLIGRLVADPAPIQHSSMAIARFRLAFDQSSAITGYVDVTAFGGTARAVLDHKSKGDQVAVTGSLRHSEWSTEDGSKRHSVVVAASRIDFLGKKHDGDPAAEPSVAEDTDNADIPF